MKKRILSILLAALMIVPMICAMPITASAEDSSTETIYSWNGFVEGDTRAFYGADQIVDLGFDGPIATAPTINGEIADGEYTMTHRIPFLFNSDTSGKYKPETEVTDYYVDVNFAVNGDYLYVAFDQTKGPALGDNDPSERLKVQFDLGVAANSSAESTWNRISMSIAANGTVSATTGAFFHEVGATEYSQGRSGLRTTDYLVDQTFASGVYEVKFDLGQLYRLFSNQTGGQHAWETPCVNFALWLTTGRPNEEGADHYCYFVSPSFRNANGRGGNWVATTVLIPEVTLNTIKAKYKGVIGPLGYDYRNAVAGQLISINEYATVTPTVDGKLTASDGYTTTGAWTGTSYQSVTGDLNAHLSVKDGYLYGAVVCKTNVFASTGYLTAFGGVNSSFLRDSRCQTQINAGGAWAGNQGGMWKVAQGPSKADAGNWDNIELNSSVSAANAWKSVVTSYDAATDTTTAEFQISIPALLAVLKFEGYNPEEANAVQFGFWGTSVGSDAASFTLPGATQTQIAQTNGYNHTAGTILPMIGLPKGCAELYFVEDVDDMGTFGQRIVEAKQSVANVDGTISAGEYTASNHYDSEDLVSYNAKGTPIASTMTQTDYYSYDDNYFYYGAKIYDPFYKEGYSSLQINLSVLNKHDSFTVENFYYTAADKSTRKIVNTLRENYIDIADVITRASWSVTGKNDGVSINMNSKPGSVIRSQTLTNGTLAAEAQAAFKTRANTFADAGYEFDGSYDAATQIYTYEAKIPLDELKNLFQIDEQFDIESINLYTLYKFNNPDVIYNEGTKDEVDYDYAMTYQLRTDKMQVAWEALRTLTQASKGSTGTPYNENTVPNVVKLVDAPLTKDSASVRLSTEYSGLRFKSVYTNEYLAWMAEYAKAQGATMEIGTLIAPADYVTAAGDFTHAALLEKYGTDATSGKAKGYVEVIAKIGTPYANANGVTTIAGSLVNIKEGNLARDFAGRGYIKIGNEYFYTDNYTVRNVSDIATLALGDTSATQTDVYKYELADGKFSPYAPGQITILEGLKSN